MIDSHTLFLEAQSRSTHLPPAACITAADDCAHAVLKTALGLKLMFSFCMCYDRVHALLETAVGTNQGFFMISSCPAVQVPFKTAINTAQAKGAVERWLLEVGREGLQLLYYGLPER
jgi:hypothetical protein